MNTQERGFNPSQPQENQLAKEILLDYTHALLAPGQGNQRIGMGSDLASRSERAAGVWRRVDEVLRPDLGYALSEKVWGGSEEDLYANAQLAIITDALARKAALEETGLLGRPGWHAGNSLGLIAALVNSGSLSIESAAHLANGRKKAFEFVTNEGPKTTMVSLEDIDEEIVERVKQKYHLETCLINSERQIVLGGLEDDVEKVAQELRDGGKRKIFPLGVNAAYHSKYMEPAVPFWTEVVNSTPIEEPKYGIVVGGSTVTKLLTPDDIRRELILQLTNTERYGDVARFLREQGVTQMTELNAVGRLTHINQILFGEGSRKRIGLPTDIKIAIANSWVAPSAPEAAVTKPEEIVSRDKVKEFYVGWISNRVGAEPTELSEDMHFIEGAGLDSEDLQAFRAALRAKFGRNVSDEEAAKILTIGAGIDATYKLMNT